MTIIHNQAIQRVRREANFYKKNKTSFGWVHFPYFGGKLSDRLYQNRRELGGTLSHFYHVLISRSPRRLSKAWRSQMQNPINSHPPSQT